MINYHSTRGDNKLYTFSEALLKGIAHDGGLLVPDRIPTFTLRELEKLKNSSYAEKAAFILKRFETDFSDKIIKKIANKAYGDNFDNQHIAPLIHLKENEFILELWHGPTWAFKDMALQLMPLLFEEAVKKNNKQKYLIVTATSGDTGKAALEGFKNKKNIFIIVLFPYKQISSIQELSMTTQEGNNIAVYPVDGTFDETQQLVKSIFTDKDFNQKLLKKYQISLSAANSINWGRLIPQIVYYFSSYLNLLEKKIIKLGDEIDVAVPSGNFGNMFAAYVAKQMGLPIRMFICASNENNILTDFLQTGIFDITNQIMKQTPSPAMDILIPSNIERLLYFVTNDSGKITLWMQQLKEKRKFVVDNITRKKLQKLFYANWVSNEDCLQTIKNTFEKTHYLTDPHTAVALAVVDKYQMKNRNSRIPIIICSTAHWAKFPEEVYQALFNKSAKAFDTFQNIEKIQEYTHASVPKNLLALKAKPVLYKEKLKAKKKIIEEKILELLCDKKEKV